MKREEGKRAAQREAGERGVDNVVCIGDREVRRRRVKMECKWSLLINVHVTCSITKTFTDLNKHGYEDPSRTYTT